MAALSSSSSSSSLSSGQMRTLNDLTNSLPDNFINEERAGCTSKTRSCDVRILILSRHSLLHRLECYYSLVSPSTIANTAQWKSNFELIYTKYGGSVEGECKLANKLMKKYGNRVLLLTATQAATEKKKSSTLRGGGGEHSHHHSSSTASSSSSSTSTQKQCHDESYYEINSNQEQQRRRNNSHIVDFTSPHFDPRYTPISHQRQAPPNVPIPAPADTEVYLGGAIDDDDDEIFIGESVSAQELVSRARAKAEARNEIIVVNDDEDSPPRNINPPQSYYPPTIPLTTKPAASNQALMFSPADVILDANSLTDDCTGATFIIDRHPFPMAQQAPGDEDDPLLRPSVKPPKLNEISTANVYTNSISVSAQELVSRARDIPGTNNENQAKSRPDENANQAGLFSPINPAYEDEDDDRSIVIPPPAANENVNVVKNKRKHSDTLQARSVRMRNSCYDESCQPDVPPRNNELPQPFYPSIIHQNTVSWVDRSGMMHPIQDINMNTRSHMEGGGYYPMSPYKNVQPPPFIGMPHGAYDHGHYSCSYHQGDAPYMHHPYHSGYGMYTPYGQGPLPPPNGPGRGQIVGQGVGPPPQVPFRPREGPTGANLFIHRLPYDLTDADLATAFNPFGNVIRATVIVDRYTGESKGFGFVSYDSITSAELALEQMNGFQLGKTRIYVERKVQANHATASMKKCMVCTKELPRERFSKHQWLGKACQRRCTECINNK